MSDMNDTEKAQLQAITQSPSSIRFIESPTEQVQLYMLNKYPYQYHLLRMIKNPIEKVRREIVIGTMKNWNHD